MRFGIAALALLGPAQARAQSAAGFALDRFDPSTPGDAFFGVSSPTVAGHLVPRGVLELDYAGRPLQVPGGAMSTVNVVSAQAFLHAAVSLALWDRVLMSLDMPVAVVDSGSSPGVAGIDYHVPSGAAAGDLRIGVRGRIFGGARDPFQLGVSGAVFAPTGSASAYAGQGSTRGTADLLLGGRAGGSGVSFVWSATGGTMLQGALISPLLRFGAGAALVLGEDRLQIGPELYGSTQLGSDTAWMRGPGIPQGGKTEMELLGGVRGRVASGFFLGAAAGPGLLSAVGSPAVRVIASAGWTPLPPRVVDTSLHDRDGDGIADEVDACPDVPGVLQADPTRDGCPIADRDHDGIPDVDDACPDKPGVKSVDATKNGCPPDADDDGIPDPEDACPNVKGVRSADPKKNGCPPDRDGDGIADDVDACPDLAGVPSKDPRFNGCPEDPDGDGIKGAADACPFEKGPPDPDPAKNGCPRFVRLDQGEIRILAQVQFKTNGFRKSETVSPLSVELMREIRDVIVEHPEISKIEVQGHTDDEGTAELNAKLSQARADIVRQWLVDNGIPSAKLVAKGYGWTRPIADNRVKTGRGLNRRVQFVILERAK